jgi:hypothetical protein
VAREEYSFYYLPTGKAQYTALRQIKNFINVRLLKIQKQTEEMTPSMIEKYAYRIIDLLKPTFTKRGTIMHYSTLDEFIPYNDINILRKIYARCISSSDL